MLCPRRQDSSMLAHSRDLPWRFLAFRIARRTSKRPAASMNGSPRFVASSRSQPTIVSMFSSHQSGPPRSIASARFRHSQPAVGTMPIRDSSDFNSVPGPYPSESRSTTSRIHPCPGTSPSSSRSTLTITCSGTLSRNGMLTSVFNRSPLVELSGNNTSCLPPVCWRTTFGTRPRCITRAGQRGVNSKVRCRTGTSARWHTPTGRQNWQ